MFSWKLVFFDQLKQFLLFFLFWQFTCINTMLLFLQPHGNASLWRTIVVCVVLN